MGVHHPPRKALLVAATGGHLAQLVRLRKRFPMLQDADVTWVTFDTAQSRSLLAGEDVIFVAFTAPRDVKHVLINAWRARAILREVAPDVVISTGSAIAASYLPLAAFSGIPTHYVESAARGTGPSLTGRFLALLRRIHLYTQYEHWTLGQWRHRGSVFDAWEPVPRLRPREVKRVLVTLGTLDFPFERLVERLVEIIPSDVEVRWQTGDTDVSRFGIDGRRTMPAAELAEEAALADVVVAHAGCGSAITALEGGKVPVLVPREHRFGEHIDDHQAQIAAVLSDRGLAIAADAERLTWEDLVAAAQAVAREAEPVAFSLDGDDATLRPPASPDGRRRAEPAQREKLTTLRSRRRAERVGH